MNTEQLNFRINDSTSPDARMLDNPNRTLESDRRLEALRGVVESYEVEHSFVEGATVFGSTMHGAAHEKSDVDAMVFIDPAKLEEEAGVKLDDDDYKDMAGSVQHDVLEALGLELGKTSSGSRNDIRVLLVNDKIIENAITKYEQLDKLEKHNRGVEADASREYWEQPLEVTELEDFDTYLKRTTGIDREKYFDFPQLGWEITGLFHPVVGEGTKITDLRNKVISRMAESSVGEELWLNVVEHIDLFEGNTSADKATEKFPKTLTQAMGLYIPEE